MSLPSDYLERVYAGVLGKIIGVYLGRPIEGWTYDRIISELGEIHYYVNHRLNVPLVVTDDDISGTFTFLRALEDHGLSRSLMPAQIGETWLNYIIENRTILWWSGLGKSTEHTAFLRLKRGLMAPLSGSIATNGKVVAEQIGAQIFIDGWGMVAAGDPAFAADLARRAASVSHDGEAIYAAQVIAALESQAFVESDLNRLIDCAMGFIPKESVVYRLISDLRDWRSKHTDWRDARHQLESHYGYDKYGGNCHIVPNHGVIILGLLYGGDDFQKSLMITNTAGWDTDCNSGNVGCLLGIKNGLSGINNGPDWRGPMADRLYLPTADGGRAITDAVREATVIANMGRAIAGESPIVHKGGSRYHFELPGSVQGFRVDEHSAPLQLENVDGHSSLGTRSLALRYRHVTQGCSARAATSTFIPPEAINLSGYSLLASPTLYPGQRVEARLSADRDNGASVLAGLYVRHYGENDTLQQLAGSTTALAPGSTHDFSWVVPDVGGQPIAEIGIELQSRSPVDGTVYLDHVGWAGTPQVAFRAGGRGSMRRRVWIDAVDQFDSAGSAFRIVQNVGDGLLMTGTREWSNYLVSSRITPHMVKRFGIAACVQGMRRYYAMVLNSGVGAQLIKVMSGEAVLARVDAVPRADFSTELGLQVQNDRIQGWIDGECVFDLIDGDRPLRSGAIALVCTEGCISADEVIVTPPI